MATFQAPPGHLSQAEVLILSRMVEAKLTVEAPDPDLKVGFGCASMEHHPPPHWRSVPMRAHAAPLRCCVPGVLCACRRLS